MEEEVNVNLQRECVADGRHRCIWGSPVDGTGTLSWAVGEDRGGETKDQEPKGERVRKDIRTSIAKMSRSHRDELQGKSSLLAGEFSGGAGCARHALQQERAEGCWKNLEARFTLICY